MNATISHRSRLLLMEMLLGISIVALVNSILAPDSQYGYPISLLLASLAMIPLELERQFNVVSKLRHLFTPFMPNYRDTAILENQLMRLTDALNAYQKASTVPQTAVLQTQLKTAFGRLTEIDKEIAEQIRRNADLMEKATENLVYSFDKFSVALRESVLAIAPRDKATSIQAEMVLPLKPVIDMPLSIADKGNQALLLDLSRAYSLQSMRRYVEADTLFRQAMLRARQHGNTLSLTLISYYWGHSQLMQGNYQEALELFEQASALLEKSK